MSNYPPGVSGREWQITGEDPDERWCKVCQEQLTPNKDSICDRCYEQARLRQKEEDRL